MKNYFYTYPRKTKEIIIDKPETNTNTINSFSEIIQQQRPVSHAVIPVAHIIRSDT